MDGPHHFKEEHREEDLPIEYRMREGESPREWFERRSKIEGRSARAERRGSLKPHGEELLLREGKGAVHVLPQMTLAMSSRKLLPPNW